MSKTKVKKESLNKKYAKLLDKKILKKPLKMYVDSEGKNYVKFNKKKYYLKKGTTKNELFKFLVNKLVKESRRKRRRSKKTDKDGKKTEIKPGEKGGYSFTDELKIAKEKQAKE